MIADGGHGYGRLVQITHEGSQVVMSAE